MQYDNHIKFFAARVTKKEIDRITQVPRRARGLPAIHTHHSGLVSLCYCSPYVSYVHIFHDVKKENDFKESHNQNPCQTAEN